LKNDMSLPKVTFALFSYNHEMYISNAVKGALEQSYENLEIIISDDNSTDSTFNIVEELVNNYEGPHDVRVQKNETNMGIGAHVSKVVNQASGDFIVLAAGDDISLPERAVRSVEILLANPKAVSVCLSADIIDSKGAITGEKKLVPSIFRLHCNRFGSKKQLLSDLLSGNAITFGAGRTVRKSVFSTFGDLNPDCPTEDTPLMLRSLMLGESVLSNEKKVLYRIHGSNASSSSSMQKINMRMIFEQYRQDILVAASKGIVNENDLRRLNVWVNNERQVRDIKIAMQQKRRLKLNEKIFTIRSSRFNFVEKVKSLL